METKLLVEVAQEMQKAGRLPCRKEWVAECQQRKRTLLRKTHFDNVPVKPQRVYEEMNKAFGRDVCYVTTIGLSQIAAAQMLHVFKDRHWINCGQAGPLGWTIPAGHWAYDSISKLAAAGVIEGYGDATFGGDKLMTRYEMAQIVAKAMAKGANVDKLAAEFADELDNRSG